MTSIQQLSNRLRDSYQQIAFVDPATGAPVASRGNQASAAPRERRDRQARSKLIDARVSLVLDRLTRWAIADATTAAQTAAQIVLNDKAVYDAALNDLDDDVIAEAVSIAAREMSDLTNPQAQQEARQFLHAWRTTPSRVDEQRGEAD